MYRNGTLIYTIYLALPPILSQYGVVYFIIYLASLTFEILKNNIN